jgi:L-fuculose-phosphate aldolase
VSLPDERAARAELHSALRELERRGLNHNTSGNVSVRVRRGSGSAVLVSPSGVPPHELTPEQLVLLADDGAPARSGQLRPTSEWRLHTAVYASRPEVVSVVHTHSPEATAASTLRAAVPAVHYVMARLGTTSLRCAPYATYGSAELAEAVVATLGATGRACLLANHGAVALGGSLTEAVELAHDVEWLCGVWRRARQLGEPVVLADVELARVAERLRSYGQQLP